MKYFIILIFFIPLIISCKNENNKPKIERDCDCQFKDFLSDVIDSSTLYSNTNLSAELEGKIQSNKLKEIIEAEVKGEVSYNNNESKTTSIIKKIHNQFPEFNNLVLYIKLSNNIFCSLYKSRCLNPKITDTELQDFADKQLNQLKEECKKELLNKSNILNSEKKKIGRKESNSKNSLINHGTMKNTSIGDGNNIKMN